MLGVGDRFADKAINHPGYANDLCLLTVSTKGMKTLPWLQWTLTLATMEQNESILYFDLKELDYMSLMCPLLVTSFSMSIHIDN